jgi:uncharacterized NAD(P)/FAD-binding protein YdhS
MTQPFRVAVVGAGFSGVMTAVHLLRARTARPIEVLMVNRSGAMARGVAYGTQSANHLLNVPAGRMSAFPDDAGHFLRYCQGRIPETTAGTFVARSIYGEYLGATLAEAEAGNPRLERVVAEVRGIRPTASGAEVEVSDGRVLAVDRVVLAVGHHPPAHPAELGEEFRASRFYVRDPWAKGWLERVPRHLPALLVGTGLTMLDVALDLKPAGVVGAVAISRRGLMPQPHDPSVAPAEPSHRPPDIEDANTIREYLSAVRRCVEAVEGNEGNWRQVVDSLRPISPQLWQRLSVEDRERFLRHLRPFWDVHRHRAAPRCMQAIEELRASGWLGVRAARLANVAANGDGVDVTILPRGRDQQETLRVGCVINCTGPSSDVTTANDPLLNHLFSSGLARPDPLRMGIDVTGDGAVVSADGTPSPVLGYVGPLLRARDGEGTAVPELRTHAARLAARLVAEAGEPAA